MLFKAAECQACVLGAANHLRRRGAVKVPKFEVLEDDQNRNVGPTATSPWEAMVAAR